MSTERRAILANDVGDFQPIHDRLIAAGEEHHGLLFTTDATMPRNKASIPLWVSTLEIFLADHEDFGAMRNRVAHLP